MDNHLLKQLLDADDKNSVAEVLQMLNEETAKPARDRDYDKIEELTEAYAFLTGSDEQEDVINQRIEAIMLKSKKIRPRISRNLKIFLSAACVGTVLFVLNCITVAAWDSNLFETIVRLTKDGFSLKSGQNSSLELFTFADDVYGIRVKCAEYGIYPEVPNYLPEGFELTDTEHLAVEGDNSIQFKFENGNQQIFISYDLVKDKETVSQIKIPSDQHNLSETKVNGKAAIISKEDDQFVIAWVDGTLVSIISAKNVPYEECEKIVSSVK